MPTVVYVYLGIACAYLVAIELTQNGLHRTTGARTPGPVKLLLAALWPATLGAVLTIAILKVRAKR